MDTISPALVSAQDAPVEQSVDAIPFMLPGRPEMRIDLPKAWRHFRNLIKDKENTAEVTPIFEALPWRGAYDAARDFLATEQGKRIFATERYLPAILDDHASLRRMPKGSLAQVYCDFMESEGLTAQGLVDDLDKYRGDRVRLDDQVEWYFGRLRDTHDMQHVLTGYGRDALGEQCVLAFTYSQQPALAHLFLGYAGALEIRRQLKSKAPVLGAVREAQRMGKVCPRIAELPIRELLPMQIDDVRKMLNITPPATYQAAHAEWRAMGIDPYDLIAPEKKAA